MKVSNNPAFCGKIEYGEGSEYAKKLLTKKIKYRIRFLPKGTIVRFASFNDEFGRIGMMSPNSNGKIFCETTINKAEPQGNEILYVLTTGLRRIKRGMDRHGWAKDCSVSEMGIVRETDFT